MAKAEAAAKFGYVVADFRVECVARFIDYGEVSRGREGAFAVLRHLYPVLGYGVELGVEFFYCVCVAAGAAQFW